MVCMDVQLSPLGRGWEIEKCSVETSSYSSYLHTEESVYILHGLTVRKFSCCAIIPHRTGKP